MASNRTPEKPEDIASLLMSALDGVHLHGEELGIEDMEARLSKNLMALGQATDACGQAKAEHAARRIEKGEAENALRDHLIRAVTCFKLSFGNRWNGQWEVLAFPAGSVEIPRNASKVNGMAGLVIRFLEEHPGMESASHGITAAIGRELMEGAAKARGALNLARSGLGEALEARSIAVKQARRSLILLRTQLEEMGPSDPRWLVFGYNCPGDPRIPEAPENVHVSESIAGSVTVEWERAMRAERYYVYARPAGSEEEPQLVARTPSANALLRSLSPGIAYEITVTAVNKAGASPPSAMCLATQ